MCISDVDVGRKGVTGLSGMGRKHVTSCLALQERSRESKYTLELRQRRRLMDYILYASHTRDLIRLNLF